MFFKITFTQNENNHISKHKNTLLKKNPKATKTRTNITVFQEKLENA